MTDIIINPGSRPVHDTTQAFAEANITKFIDDLKDSDVDHLSLGDIDYSEARANHEGRYTFELSNGKSQCEIDMPGIALEGVRYMKRENQDIWDYPRLCVDGGSWVWFYALKVTREALRGEIWPGL